MTDDEESLVTHGLGVAWSKANSAVVCLHMLDVPRSPESVFIRAHMSTALKHLGEALQSIAEAQGMVGLTPLESIEHDADANEAARILADRDRDRVEFDDA